jgi:hypothetical protein
MTYILSVVYPAGAKFDMEYYLSTHVRRTRVTSSPLYIA